MIGFQSKDDKDGKRHVEKDEKCIDGQVCDKVCTLSINKPTFPIFF